MILYIEMGSIWLLSARFGSFVLNYTKNVYKLSVNCHQRTFCHNY